MSGESTTPDVVDLTREFYVTATRQDLDALMRFYARDAEWDMSAGAMGSHRGVAAIAAFVQGWWDTWQDHHHEIQEILDLGHGVVFAVVREDGQLIGSDRYVEQRAGWVFLWIEGKVAKGIAYLDVDEALAAGERLAASRD